MTLGELKAKYTLSEGAKYEPKADCRHCKGVGERPVKREPGRMTFCICLYVDHAASDEIGSSLGQFATRELNRMTATPKAQEGEGR